MKVDGCAIMSLGNLPLSVLSGKPTLNVTGIGVSVILNFIDGENIHENHLRSFLNSNKSIAYFKFDTHCVNRGNMYREPMYDYVVDDVRMTY